MNKVEKNISICWFRRDLRLDDQAALYYALKSPYPVIPLFIFDTNILDKLENKSDRRVDFIFQVLEKLNADLQKHSGQFQIEIGKPIDIFKKLSVEYTIKEIHCNEDYEPYAIERDRIIEEWSGENRIRFKRHTDQIIFAPGKILKPDKTPYTVYTPFSKKWKSAFKSEYTAEFKITDLSNLYRENSNPLPDIQQIGFKKTDLKLRIPEIETLRLNNYKETRDFPYLDSTSKISIHLRFGTISIRKLVQFAVKSDENFLNELIWREFFMHIVYFFPEVEQTAFQAKFKNIEWNTDLELFNKWCDGKTGYPIVDAGMRELASTGYMHNRVRMITANFLTKILFIDWRLGEKWFADKLDDYDLALNNGNWQWAAGCGCDAAPYFRIFNPDEQIKKFDPELKYIRKWVPEFESFEYPKPMVDYKSAREKYLNVMAKQLKK